VGIQEVRAPLPRRSRTNGDGLGSALRLVTGELALTVSDWALWYLAARGMLIQRGKMRRRVGVLLIPIVVLAGCGAVRSDWRSQTEVNGTGTGEGAVVDLAGDYWITWTMWARPPNCLATLGIQSATDASLRTDLPDDGRARSSETRLQGLKFGSYLVSGGSSDCGPWQVIIVPQ
jgi:hypothetical protein